MEIIGHRGAKGLAPENTLEGFKAGIKAGADWIEFDVRATRDGRLVVIHDSSTLRASGHRLKVIQTDYETLSQIRIFGHHRIPTLTEAINTIGGHAKINIEIKSSGCAKTVVSAIENRVKRGASYGHFSVSSFKIKLLRQVQNLNPKIQLGLLHLINPYKFLRAPGLHLQSVGFHHRLLPSQAITIAKQRRLKVYAYTIDSPKKAARLKLKGLDGIVTNRPDLMKNL